jgi:uncharacterized protein (TIGR02266 family)
MARSKIERPFRLTMRILITLKDDQKSILAYCRNLSVGGIFVESSDPVAVGTLLSIEFVLPNNKKKLFLKGKVIWSANAENPGELAGMGVNFESLDQASAVEIERTVSYLRNLEEKGPQ